MTSTDKLIESSRADLEKALLEEERLAKEAELLSKKILTNKQAIDEMERDPSGAAESSQRVQNQKAVLEGKFNELSKVSDSIGELSAKQTEQKDAIKVLESEVSVANQKVSGLQKVAEGKLASLQESYRPKTPPRDMGQKYQIQSPEAKKIEGALNTRIQRQIEAFEIEERIAKERLVKAREEAENIAKAKENEEKARREAEQKILDAAAAKREKEYKEQRAKEEEERKAVEKIKEEERRKAAAAALKVRQEEEAKQKERDRVSSLSSTAEGLKENRRKNRNLTMQLRDAKASESEIIAQDTTGKYKDLLAAPKKVKDWESKLNDPKEDKKGSVASSLSRHF